MKKYLTARYDRVFKTLFCNEDNNILLMALLSKILKRNITSIRLLNKELPLDKVDEKTKTVDVLAVVDRDYIHIELNSSCHSFLHVRNYIYFSNIYASRSKRGENYKINTNFIHIDLTYGLKSDYDYMDYYVMNEGGIKYVDNIKIIEFNMDKIKKYCYTSSKEKYEEYKYLIMLDMTKEELEKYSRGDKIMEEYKSKLDVLNDTEMYESFITPEEDYQFCLNTERLLGKEEGIQEGIKEKTFDIVKTLKSMNYSIEEISKITKLSINELKKI